MGNPGIIHNRTPDCQPNLWAWMRPQLPDFTTECSFDSQAMWVIYVLDLNLSDLKKKYMYLYYQALGDVLLTGAGI